MSRVKKLDTKILTVADVVSDFGWRNGYWMFDDKFPYRIMVEVGATHEAGDFDHMRSLLEQVERGVSSRSIHNTSQTVCDPQQFAEVLARLMH